MLTGEPRGLQLPHESAFDLSVFLFDTQQRQFLGRQWVSEVRAGQGTDQLLFRDTLFLLVPAQQADALVLVVELVKRDPEPWVFGWTVVPLRPTGLTDFAAAAAQQFPWKRWVPQKLLQNFERTMNFL